MSSGADHCWQTPIAATLFAVLAGAPMAQAPVPSLPLRPPVPAAPPAAAPAEVAPDAALQDPAATAAGGAAAIAAKAKNDAATRLQKWRQVKFDRRPSAILQAWAAPELKPYDPNQPEPPATSDSIGAAAAMAGSAPADTPEEQAVVDIGGARTVVF